MSGRIPQNESSDEEGDFLASESSNALAASSRLGSLFSHAVKVDGNASLTYKAPKQPVSKESSPELQKASATDADGVPVKVLHAAAVHAFLLKDGQYASQGKIGAAVLGNRSKLEYKILLYLSNKKPIGQATITNAFKIDIRTNNYVQFMDDRMACWSLAFESEVQLLSFLKYVLAVKALLLGDHHKEILSLDIDDGDGNTVGEGDSLEIEYTEFLVEDGPTITEFNGNINSNQKPLRVKLGKGEAPKGWMDGLVGMKKRGKRLFVIPPDLGYSGHDSSPSFPTNAPLMVYAIVKRVKFAKPDEPKVERKLSTDSALSGSAVESASEQETQQKEIGDSTATQKSASETDVNKKADLINRMARIGHAVIGATPVIPTPTIQNSEIQKPSLPVKPAGLHNQLAVVCAEITLPKAAITDSTADISAPVTTAALHGSQSTPHLQNPGDFGTVPFQFQSMPPAGSAIPFMYPFAYPPQSYFLQPPFLPPTMHPTPANDAASTAQSSIVEEIQKCHLQLQDALTKTVVTNFENSLKQIAEMNGRMESRLNELRSTGAPGSPIEITGAGSNSETVLQAIMAKLEQIEAKTRSSWMQNAGSVVEKLATLADQLEAKLQQLKAQEHESIQRNYSSDSNSPYSGLMESLQGLTEKMSQWQTAMESIDSMRSELASANEWKEKHEKLKTQALAMKEKFEERIRELEERSEQREHGEVGISEQEKVKKIMSSFYKTVSQRFPDGEQFDGDAVRRIILDSVKESTLHALRSSPDPDDANDTDHSEQVNADVNGNNPDPSGTEKEEMEAISEDVMKTD